MAEHKQLLIGAVPAAGEQQQRPALLRAPGAADAWARLAQRGRLDSNLAPDPKH
jgi:hypothetical protein